MAIDDRKNDTAHLRWAALCKQRDNFSCVICGRRGIYLEAHHKNSYSAFPDERYDLDNGATLCKDHHDGFHQLYTKQNNTVEQFEEYQEICEILMKIAEKKYDTQLIVKKIIEQVDGYGKV